MKASFLIYTFLISLSFLFGNKNLRQADKAYKQENFSKAIILYEQYKTEQEGDKVEPETAVKMANCYYFLNDYEKAKKHFDLAGESNLEGNNRATYGKLLFLQGDYDKAETYLNTEQASGSSDLYMERINWMKTKTADTSLYEIKQTDINTFGQSFGVQYYEGGIVFSSSNNNTNVLDYRSNLNSEKPVDLKGLEFLNLYYSPVINNGGIGSPVLFSENLKFDYHVGAVTFSSDKNKMYYTRVVKLPKEQTVLKIYEAKYVSGMWHAGYPLNFNSDAFNNAHPALSTSGDTLFFVSDRPGGKGGKDIWFSRKSGSYWLQPQNLAAVNTANDELFPYVAADNTFYFASNGYSGYGGLDVYKTNLKDKDAEITNLKYGINTRFDDFAFIVNPENLKEGYLSSNRSTGGRYDNIFRIKLMEESKKDSVQLVITDSLIMLDSMTRIISIVANALSGDPIAEALVVYTDQMDNSLLYEGLTDQDGKAEFEVEEDRITPDSDIKLAVRAKGKFEPFEKHIKGRDLTEDTASFTEINLVPIIEETQTITIPENKLKFALNSYTLSYDAKKILERWYQYLNANQNIRIRLNAHTDSQGDLDYNLELSQKRADSAKSYLTQRGINSGRIVARGYGERYILNHCKDGVDCSDAEHKENRRIEIIVIVD